MERAQGVAVPRIMSHHSMGVRWWFNGAVMADGVYKRENSKNTTVIDRLDKEQNTENRGQGFIILTRVWSSDVSGEDVLHSRRHPQAEKGRPGQRQLPETGVPQGKYIPVGDPQLLGAVWRGEAGKEQ